MASLFQTRTHETFELITLSVCSIDTELNLKSIYNPITSLVNNR